MQQAKSGDTVHVHYKGSLEDGTVFDTSDGGQPLQFTIGSGDVIPGFEEAIVGMAQGDQKRQSIPADQAYGSRREELVFQVEREQLPPNSEVSVGDYLRIGFPDGRTAAVQVAEIGEASVTLDANHPLAGKTLVFDLTLVDID
jgi:peptidylprolyl isomerase